MDATLLDSATLHDAAEDLRTLAWLHQAERSASTWVALHRAGFPRGLGLPDLPASEGLSGALSSLAATLLADPGRSEDRADDALAADFADIYLTHAYKASPYESVWRDEDKLMMQGPTFAVRACYRRHGMAVPDWRAMPDDHLSHELAFVSHLLAQGKAAAAARFLDDHLLTWLPDFAQRVAQRARTTVYAGLARLTDEYCRRLRGGLGEAEPRGTPEPSAAVTTACAGQP